MTAKVYIDKAKVLEAISEHCDPRYDDIITKIEDGVFDTVPVVEDGYMLVYIEDYNNKTKLLKEKDAEIARLKNGDNHVTKPCEFKYHPSEIKDQNFNLCRHPLNKTGSCMCSWILKHGFCPCGYGNKINDVCPICNQPLYGSGKALTSMEDEKIVHLGCLIAEPCDCQHERDGCTYSGHCKYRRAPDKDLNGTWLPTCGLKFPEGKK